MNNKKLKWEDRIAINMLNEKEIYNILYAVHIDNQMYTFEQRLEKCAKALFDRLCSEIKKKDKKPIIYKVGDSVKVRQDLIENETYPTLLLHPFMVQYLGKEAKIKAIHSLSVGKVYELDIAPNWSWSWQMLEQ